MAPVLDELFIPLDVELLFGDTTGVMLHVGEKALTISVVALASHWHGYTEKFLRS